MMPSNKRPRKPHKQREVFANPIDWAIAGVHTFPVETQRDLLKITSTAFDKFRTGKADRDDWNMLCQCFNVAEALAEAHIGDNLRPDFERGHDALHAIALRMLGGGSSTCYASELALITEAIDMHRIQLQLCTQAEYSRAIKRVKEMINSGGLKDAAKVYAGMVSLIQESA